LIVRVSDRSMVSASTWTWLAVIVTVPLPALLAAAATIFSPGPSAVGYWSRGDSTQTSSFGAPANHDFCEANYAVTPYVAELHNTWTSALIIAVAVVGAYNTRTYACKDTRFGLAFASIGVTGVGSVLFHGALRRWGQIADEVPMIMWLFCIVYMLAEQDAEPHYGMFLPMLLAALWVATVALYLIFDFYLFFLVVIIGGAIAVAVVSLFTLYTKGNRLIWAVFFMGLANIAIAVPAWVVDHNFCEYTQAFHLHPIWHVTIAMGCYLFVLCHVVFRARALGKVPLVILPNRTMLQLSEDGGLTTADSRFPCKFWLPYVAFQNQKNN